MAGLGLGPGHIVGSLSSRRTDANEVVSEDSSQTCPRRGAWVSGAGVTRRLLQAGEVGGGLDDTLRRGLKHSMSCPRQRVPHRQSWSSLQEEKRPAD